MSTRASSNRILWVVLALALSAGPAAAAHREKTDVITLTNGDRVTGELKQLAQGVLTVKTHFIDTIQIEWVGVQAIESSQVFEVETQSGARYQGTIAPGGDGSFTFSGPDGSKTLSHDDVVQISQLGEGYRSRWTGHVSLGFSLASANSATSLSLDSAATRRTPKRTSSYTLSSNFSDRDDADRTWRTLAGASHKRTLRGNLFWVHLAQLENNQELDLEIRATVGAGVGYYVVRNAHSELALSAGLLGNRELYYSQPAGDWTLEMLVAGSYNLYLFGRRDTTLNTSLGILPSLSTWGRVRLELNTSFRRKLSNSLTLSLSFYESYDSDSPSATAATNDWNLTTSLGWTF